MLSVSAIKHLFDDLNRELSRMNVVGEICLCGGAVMCLVFQSREATKDIDAVFEPTAAIRKAAKRVAAVHGLNEGWLNDAAKGFFVSDPPRIAIMEKSHLRIWAPPAKYMLAMKCVSARFDSHDRDDVEFLIGHLGLKKVEEVFDLIAEYYPRHEIPAKTRFLVEELLP